MRPSQRAVDQAIARSFPPDAVDRVRTALDQYGTAPHEREPFRVRLAILNLAAGDELRLRELIAIARRDYRDVLLWAEYPDQARLDTEEKRRAFRAMCLRFGIELPPGLEE